ncbi:MAG: GNAT family N-acetyltransferase [Chloracidobacterium sp. CP2_5A]|nr:MAG: GNAT family N-acetyltransferase [Chloracidobacterium sp. CP2_5A]
MNAQSELTFEVVPSGSLAASSRQEIIDLCSAAYEEDFLYYLDLLPNPVHLLARHSGTLVSHAAWVTRWLQIEEDRILRTAYVEAVATAPKHQRRGYASAVMQRLTRCLDGFEIGALSPSDVRFYERLGWELWRGPLAARAKEGLLPTPGEEVMIYRLSGTPALDLNALLTVEWREGEVW